MKANVIAIVAAVLGSSCVFDEPTGANDPGRTAASERAAGAPSDGPLAELPTKADGAPRAAVDLEQCRRFDSYPRYRAWAASATSSEDTAPERNQHGLRTDEMKDHRDAIAWAEGYSQSDESQARAWWACLLPLSFTEDIQPLEDGYSVDWAHQVAKIKLFDQGQTPDGKPRREYVVAVDLKTRRALPRVLSSFSTGAACSVERECDLKDGGLSAEPWPSNVSAECAPMLRKLARPGDAAVGIWRFEDTPSKDSSGGWM